MMSDCHRASWVDNTRLLRDDAGDRGYDKDYLIF